MEVLTDYHPIKLKTRQVVTIGFFDGFHRGHQKIARKAFEIAEKLNIQTTVVTFHPLDSGRPILLSTREEKLYLLSQAGFTRSVILSESSLWKNLSPSDFIRNFLIDKLNASWVIVGEDFRFGKNRAGDINTLKSFENKDFHIEAVKLLEHKNEKISSTQIRTLADTGDLDAVCELTGRNYFFFGEKVTGEGLGRQLGYPTINFKVSNEKILPKGVFICRAMSISPGEDKKNYGACYIGPVNIPGKKTSQKVELHLLRHSIALEKDIKGAELIKKIRTPREFSSLEDLKAQIGRDIKKIRVDIQNGYK